MRALFLLLVLVALGRSDNEPESDGHDFQMQNSLIQDDVEKLISQWLQDPPTLNERGYIEYGRDAILEITPQPKQDFTWDPYKPMKIAGPFTVQRNDGQVGEVNDIEYTKAYPYKQSSEFQFSYPEGAGTDDKKFVDDLNQFRVDRGLINLISRFDYSAKSERNMRNPSSLNLRYVSTEDIAKDVQRTDAIREKQELGQLFDKSTPVSMSLVYDETNAFNLGKVYNPDMSFKLTGLDVLSKIEDCPHHESCSQKSYRDELLLKNPLPMGIYSIRKSVPEVASLAPKRDTSQDDVEMWFDLHTGHLLDLDSDVLESDLKALQEEMIFGVDGTGVIEYAERFVLGVTLTKGNQLEIIGNFLRLQQNPGLFFNADTLYYNSQDRFYVLRDGEKVLVQPHSTMVLMPTGTFKDLVRHPDQLTVHVKYTSLKRLSKYVNAVLTEKHSLCAKGEENYRATVKLEEDFDLELDCKGQEAVALRPTRDGLLTMIREEGGLFKRHTAMAYGVKNGLNVLFRTSNLALTSIVEASQLSTMAARTIRSQIRDNMPTNGRYKIRDSVNLGAFRRVLNELKHQLAHKETAAIMYGGRLLFRAEKLGEELQLMGVFYVSETDNSFGGKAKFADRFVQVLFLHHPIEEFEVSPSSVYESTLKKVNTVLNVWPVHQLASQLKGLKSHFDEVCTDENRVSEMFLVYGEEYNLRTRYHCKTNSFYIPGEQKGKEIKVLVERGHEHSEGTVYPLFYLPDEDNFIVIRPQDESCAGHSVPHQTKFLDDKIIGIRAFGRRIPVERRELIPVRGTGSVLAVISNIPYTPKQRN